jgi:hypothetical protein
VIDYKKERNERRRQLIARCWGIQKSLHHSSDTIRILVEKAKIHEINEWDLAEQTQQEVLQIFAECGLTEMMEAFMAFILVNQAMEYGQKEIT